MSTHYIALGGKTYKVVLTPGQAATVDGKPFQIAAELLQPGVLSLLLTAEDGTVRSLSCVADDRPGDPAVLIEGCRYAYTLTDPRSLQAGSAAAGEAGPRPLKSPMPGRIVRVLVAAGERVEAGQGCVVIEAMKMQNELKAPRAGVIGKLAAAVGDTVAANAVLLVVE